MDTILLVEDEYPIARLLQVYLEKAGYRVVKAKSAEEGRSLFISERPRLVLLDIMLPGEDGFTLLKEIRVRSSCPVIMVTARGDVRERLHGFQLGADDYIPKPFDPEEVVARVQAVLRRPPVLLSTEAITHGSLVIDLSTRSATLAGQSLNLGPRDWSLLAFLARHPNKCFSRDQLITRVWGLDYEGGDRAVDGAVKRLRHILRDMEFMDGEIETVRGMGYMLRVHER